VVLQGFDIGIEDFPIDSEARHGISLQGRLIDQVIPIPIAPEFRVLRTYDTAAARFNSL